VAAADGYFYFLDSDSQSAGSQQEVPMSAIEDFPKVSPFLWFESKAEEAVDFYLSVFRNSRRIGEQRRAIDDPSGPKGTVLTVSFELEGQRFTALNGGPFQKFTDAISFVIRCESQQEIDEYWTKLSAGGTEIQCGWLRDKYGLCWQVVPARLTDLLKSAKAMEAMMRMKKLDIAELERAAQS
jgi:predicted 3-demethylubiquinone-9 3-methyltransferase (glyoxalase superfamily)